MISRSSKLLIRKLKPPTESPPPISTLTPLKLSRKDWISPPEAVKIFNTITDPKTILDAFNLYSSRKDFKPTQALYLSIFTRLAHAKDFVPVDRMLQRLKLERNCALSDEFFREVLKLYSNVGRLPDRVVQIIYDMPEFEVWPSSRTFCFVLNCLVSRKRFDLVYQVFTSAAKLGVGVDSCCVNIVIKGLCDGGSLEAALQVFDEFPDMGLSPNVRTFSTLMRALCKAGRVDEAFLMLERMERDEVTPDVISFNILLAGLRKEGRVEECVEVLERVMKLKGCEPNRGSYQEVFYGLLGAETYVEAKEFMDGMVRKGMSPSLASYRGLFLGFCKTDCVDNACWALEGLVKQGFVPNKEMWRQVIRAMFLTPSSESSGGEFLAHVLEK